MICQPAIIDKLYCIALYCSSYMHVSTACTRNVTKFSSFVPLRSRSRSGKPNVTLSSVGGVTALDLFFGDWFHVTSAFRGSNPLLCLSSCNAAEGAPDSLADCFAASSGQRRLQGPVNAQRLCQRQKFVVPGEESRIQSQLLGWGPWRPPSRCHCALRWPYCSEMSNKISFLVKN